MNSVLTEKTIPAPGSFWTVNKDMTYQNAVFIFCQYDAKFTPAFLLFCDQDIFRLVEVESDENKVYLQIRARKLVGFSEINVISVDLQEFEQNFRSVQSVWDIRPLCSPNPQYIYKNAKISLKRSYEYLPLTALADEKLPITSRRTVGLSPHTCAVVSSCTQDFFEIEIQTDTGPISFRLHRMNEHFFDLFEPEQKQ